MSDVFAGGGEMGALMRSLDWAASPLGPVEGWPQSLRTAVSICLDSRFPILIWWGRELVMLYNDAYRPMLGATKHPTAMGQRGRECWPEIWHIIGPMLEGVLDSGTATWSDDQLLVLDRNGYLEECYFTFSYSPIRDERGGVGGVFCAVTETTQRVLGERRLRTLRDLADRTAKVTSDTQVCRIVAEVLADNAADLPFALIYLRDGATQWARLAGAAGLAAGAAASPDRVALTVPRAETPSPWALWHVVQSGQSIELTDLSAYQAALPTKPWDVAPHTALVLPISGSSQEQLAGWLVVGISPRRALDDDYRGFLALVAGQIATALASARAYTEERQRAEALAELDRAKTTFFSNVSHEFRTPLTLLLGPLEEVLAHPNSLPVEDRRRLDAAHRNSLRLLKLVNTLLDFSRIEAGRMQASYQPTDLAALTADLASVFRSAIERAGLRLRVTCPPLAQPVYVDREMWEKIVLNLLSNAFKFTFVGEIEVALRQADELVELAVSDTGTGIPAEELPHVFERFHRVTGARGRTFEGSGIGLALVQELVKLHGGTLHVASEVDRGTTFTVSIPLGTAHLPAERIKPAPTLAATTRRGEAYVEETLRWLPDTTTDDQLDSDLVAGRSSVVGGRILLADDNADMREYIRRLLGQTYDVVAVNDGAAALQAAGEAPFDLVLADVMMPHLDGFALIAALRADERTRTLPVILLSARAGEEARIEGLEAGADDYLIKPFSARELLVRVSTRLELARLRAQLDRDRAGAEEALRTSENRLRMAALAGAIGIWDIDLRSGVRTWSEQGKAIYGLAAHEHMDYERQLALTHPDDRARVHAAVTAFRDHGTVKHLELEHRIVRPDGSERWVAARGEAIYDGGTLPIRLIGTVIDITERKRAEQALRAKEERLQALYEQEQAARAQAEEASRLKDEFLATVSHELRTPLTAFLGYAQMLQTRKRDEAYVARTIEKMVRSAKTQAQLIEDLLDVSRIVSGKLRIEPQPIDLISVIRAALDTVRPAVEAKGLHLHIALSFEASAIIGDANRLQQVVWNLLSNATKFTQPGGMIQVRLEKHGREAQLTVSDTGQGINRAFLPYVFDRFRQADSTSNRAYSGLGLGLAIVRHLVELHGGAVRATSAGEGQGASFTVRLPLAIEDAAEVASDATDGDGALSGCPPELRGLRVLIVDDQQDILELLRDMLASCGAVVGMCGTAREALETVRIWQPQVLVSDIAMPGEDGYWLIRGVRALAPQDGGAIPAAALTAYARVEERMRVLEAGFQLYVPKPVEPDELRAVVAHLARTRATD